MFKKIIKYFLLMFVFLSFIPTQKINAEELNEVNIYYFYSVGCAHCAAMEEYFDDKIVEYPNLIINKYNVATSEGYNLLNDFAQTFNESQATTPFVVIGGKYFVGHNSSTEAYISNLIEKYSNNDFVDIGYKVINGLEVLESDFDTSLNTMYNLPIIGLVDVKGISLFLITMVMGFVDGFNPCAMWVLIFLISMLIAGKDRKRMWILGTVFLLASAGVYFLMMVAWLKTIQIVSAKFWFQLGIGIFALLAGGYHLYKYLKNVKQDDVGCEVVDDKSKKKIFERIKKVVTEKNFFIAIIGIIVLAVTVNFIEIACSAGLPVLYSQILLINGIEGSMQIMYILLYILFFLLDDLIVFSIAMFTFKLTGISNKYTKYSSLIGGVLMLIIGFLLIFFPNIIMFNF